jgi:tRNA threonylcarbamoyladenosine biosynthesis protein TsaE
MTTSTIAFDRCSEDQLPKIAAAFVASIKNQSPFRVWLIGDLGAGKTTLVRHMLHKLGLPEGEPVLSPTYTYLNEYQIDGKWYAHLDLYRIKNVFASEVFDSLEARTYAGIFCEWPNAQELDGAEAIAPTHQIVISKHVEEQQRSYKLSRFR